MLAGIDIPHLKEVPFAAFGGGTVYVRPGESPESCPSLRDGQLRALHAAALRDVCGYSPDRICGELSLSEARVAKDCYGRGRKLWAALAAWPWWALNPTGGPLPDQWWTLPYVTKTFTVWRDGAPV